MTVREACTSIDTDCEINILWNGYVIDFDRRNGLMIDAYSDYIVEQIHVCKNTREAAIELIIEALPRKKQS